MKSEWSATCGRRLPIGSSEPDTRQTIPRRHRHAAGMSDQGQVCAAGHRLRRHLSPAGLQKLSRPEAGSSVVLLRGRCFGGGLSQGADLSIDDAARAAHALIPATVIGRAFARAAPAHPATSTRHVARSAADKPIQLDKAEQQHQSRRADSMPRMISVPPPSRPELERAGRGPAGGDGRRRRSSRP